MFVRISQCLAILYTVVGTEKLSASISLREEWLQRRLLSAPWQLA